MIICLTFILVLSAKIVIDRVSDKSKGFGFVTFASEDEAQKALTEMNGKVILYGFQCSIPLPLFCWISISTNDKAVIGRS